MLSEREQKNKAKNGLYVLHEQLQSNLKQVIGLLETNNKLACSDVLLRPNIRKLVSGRYITKRDELLKTYRQNEIRFRSVDKDIIAEQEKVQKAEQKIIALKEKLQKAKERKQNAENLVKELEAKTSK